MAKVLTNDTGHTHLRSDDKLALCGASTGPDVIDADLTCTLCARIALLAIETSTKAERREWRKL